MAEAQGQLVIPRRTKIKVCGITCLGDAALAGQLGADAIGLNFYAPSPRCISVEAAREIVAVLPPAIETVAVFVDMPVEQIAEIIAQTGISMAQFHGKEPAAAVAELAPHRVLRAFRWQGTSTVTEVNTYLDQCHAAGRLPAGLLIDTHRRGVPGGTGESWDWQQAADWACPLPTMLAGGLTPDNVADAIRSLHPYGVDVAGGVEARPGVKDPQKLRAFFAAVHQMDRLIAGE